MTHKEFSKKGGSSKSRKKSDASRRNVARARESLYLRKFKEKIFQGIGSVDSSPSTSPTEAPDTRYVPL